MIKNLLLATSFALAPLNAQMMQTEITYNKTIGNTLYSQATPQAINYYMSNYSFNQTDNWQVINSTIGFKDTQILSVVFTDNMRISSTFTYNEVKVSYINFSCFNNNYYEYNANNKNLTTLNQTNLQNLYTVKYAYNVLNPANTNTAENIQTLINQRKTDASAVYTQINQIYSAVNNQGSWDENDGIIQRTNNPNFEEQYNNAMNYTFGTNGTYNWYTESTTDQTEEYSGWLQYVEFTYRTTENWTNLDENTKNSYLNIFQNANRQIEIKTAVKGTQIVVNTDGIVDIPGLIFTILGMPFAWFSTAFDITLFPGTPYSVNIALLLIGIIGLLLTIFIIKKILK